MLDKSKYYFLRGNNLFKAGKYEEAINIYTKGKEKHPELSVFFEKNIELCELRDSKLIGLTADHITNKIGTVHSKELVNMPFIDEWDTRKCISTTANIDYEVPKRIFIAPAVLRPRNTTRYRVLHLKEMLDIITAVDIINFNNLTNDFYNTLTCDDVVIVQRVAFDKKSEVFFNALRNTPATIVYDIDDQIFDASVMEEWRIKKLDKHPDMYLKAMKYADHFTTSTKQLRAKIETMFDRPVHILSNLISEEIVSMSEISIKDNQECSHEDFVIGYASGSTTHDYDLEVALKGVDKFLSEKNDVKFHCIGDVNLPKWFQNKHKAKIITTNKVEWQALPSKLINFDLQIIPLADSSFNNYKSQIRYLESSMVKVPVLCSNVGEQSISIINYETGVLCRNNESSWYNSLNWYYCNKIKSKVIAENAYSFVREYFTTSSEFRKYKLKEILKDFSLKIMRDKISIVLVIYNPIHDIKEICNSIIKNTNVPYELLIWINSEDDEIIDYINTLKLPNKLVVNIGKNVGKAIAANQLFDLATERFICGLDDDYVLPAFWAEKMIVSAKAIPNLGWLSSNLTEDSSGIRGLGKSASFSGGISIYVPSGVGGWMVFTTASQREKIGYYSEHGLYGGVDGDYNRRTRSMNLVTGYVRSVVGKHKVQRQKSLSWELFKQRIQDNMRIHGKQSDNVSDKFTDFFKDRTNKLTCSIKISTSITHDENVWGDTHYAYGLKKSLEKLDYEVEIDKHEEWYSGKEKKDIVVHLFGLHEYEPDPYSINIIWLISHVDKINRKQLLKYDYIFCASEKVMGEVKKLAPEIKAKVLFQCTDIQVFNSNEAVEKDIDVLFVGNSRRVYRDSVRYAVELGYNVEVWGTKWEQFIPKRFIKGQAIDSNRVSDLYRRAKVVLNDHWDDQVKYELMNNRVFDVIACQSMILSDKNLGIEKIFGENKIPMYKDKKDFKIKLDSLLLENDKNISDIKELSSYVKNEHSFDNRASIINEAVVSLIFEYVDYKSEFLNSVREKELRP